jgi:hypothetical protein
MTAAFCPEPKEMGPRGGTLVVDKVGRRSLRISVRFALPPGDREAVQLSQDLGSEDLTFSYLAKGVELRAIRELVQASLQSVHTAESVRFQKKGHGHAFNDAIDLGLALYDLAKTGRDILGILFDFAAHERRKDFDLSGIPEGDRSLFGRLLLLWLRSSDHINVIAPRMLIPWNILFSGDVPDRRAAVDPVKFWALGRTFTVVPPGISMHVRMRRNWVLAAGIESKQEELKYGSDLHSDPAHPFVRFEENVRRSDDVSSLLAAFQDGDILYHYGHAGESLNSHEFGRIGINGSELRASELAVRLRSGSIRLPEQNPLLAFLNGCLTGVGKRNETTICGTLVEYADGRFCVLSTWTRVAAWPAAEFSRLFFDAFLSGQSLGESVLLARKRMFERFFSPVGLFYASYGMFHLRIQEAK